MSEQKPNPKREAARASLPEELRPRYDEFCEDYRFQAEIVTGRKVVCWEVAAAMVRTGWRCDK